MSKVRPPRIGIIMGSDSDLPVMVAAVKICEDFNIPYTVKVLSAHRNAEGTKRFAASAQKNGIQVIIAGAGGAAHLPGVIASYTTLPVIGVPVLGKATAGLDALLSIVQMPPGVPVAATAINGAKNAALLAVQILAVSDTALARQLLEYKKRLQKQSRDKNRNLAAKITHLLNHETT
ncbi:MAG: 5-(carboxyamino)imidazole ribonucleotide mutase [Chlorobi bacterium]|nr:5-(carboxyamino)imidazole ribonucleotide mutase [Chlorobiota bacterium]